MLHRALFLAAAGPPIHTVCARYHMAQEKKGFNTTRLAESDRCRMAQDSTEQPHNMYDTFLTVAMPRSLFMVADSIWERRGL